MFGPLPNVQRMLGTMSVPELVKIAQNPSGGDSTVQYAAISEIENRKKMQAPPQAAPNQPTVIERMAMEAMTPPAPTPVPGDPKAAGVAALMQQQQAGPPQRMNGGGPILSRLDGTVDTLRPYYEGRLEGMTPEEWQELRGQLYGDGSYLDELVPGMKEDEERARTGRNTDLWLSLARAGFGMASTGNIGEGAIMGLDSAQEGLGNYREAMSDVRGRRERVSMAQGQREDQLSGAGLEAILDSRNQANAANRDMISTAAGIAEAGASIDAASARDSSQLERIADMLFQENQGQMVEDGTGRSMGGAEIPFYRPYSREDALRDAILMSGSGSRGAAPDDASELGQIDRLLADRRGPQRGAARDNLIALRNALAARARANGLDVPDWNDERAQTARGGSAPGEAGFIRPEQSQIDAYREANGSRVVGTRDGQRVISPYDR